MGCKHSVEVISGGDGKDIAVNDDLQHVNNRTTEQQQQQQQRPLLQADEFVDKEDENDTRSRHTNDVNNDGPVVYNKDRQQDDSRNDDFTKDYIILKQVMGGASALSHIYMVMKRQRPIVDDTQQKEQQQEQQQMEQQQTNTDNIETNITTTPTTTDDNVYVLQVIDMDSVAPERRKPMRKEIHSLKSIVHPNSTYIFE
jgi:hypothetical protein